MAASLALMPKKMESFVLSCNEMAGRGTIPREDEPHPYNSKSLGDAQFAAASPETCAWTGGAGRFPMRDPESLRPAQGIPRRVSPERNSGIHTDGDRSHSRNQYRHGAGTLEKRSPSNRSPGRFRRHGAREVTALANSLKRIWSAKNRVPHLTGWGTFGSRKTPKDETTLACWAHERVLELVEVFQRNAPTFIVVACNLFR